MTSARAAAYRRGMSERFRRFRELRPYVRSHEKRETRYRERLEAFVGLAVETGIDPVLVAAQFRPENVCHGPIRIRDDLGTVEWRAPDTALPSEVVRLAFDVAGVLEECLTKPVVVGSDVGVHLDRIVVPPFELLSSLSDEAIDEGLTPRVGEYLAAFGFDVSAYSPLTERFPTDDPLPEPEVRRLRLAAADALERDVAALAARSTSPRDGETARGRTAPAIRPDTVEWSRTRGTPDRAPPRAYRSRRSDGFRSPPPRTPSTACADRPRSAGRLLDR